MSEHKVTLAFRASAVIALILSSIIVIMNPATVNDAINSSVEKNDSGENSIVGLMEAEKWPVLRVEFPDKPFPNSILESLFDGNLSANQYIDQMSGGRSHLDATIIDGVWQSPYPESHWGTDSSDERDVGIGGGAKELAEETILSLMSDIDPSIWDLDGDYIIDRVLILHSGQPQELGGTSTRIWSHFSPFNDPVVIGEYKFEHYTMASIHGGLGVIVHEMLHQMGAVDLYDVHSDSPTKSWHGLGDWDIMASGNWIDDGDRPSLPSASTLNLIGAIEPTNVERFTNLNYTLIPVSDGGGPLRIDLAPGEIIWVSFRSQIGFDLGLPGHGILVEQQDLQFGDIDSNLVNTDPTRPWTRIIEADGNDALLRGRDYGDREDLFGEDRKFGNMGHKIWDNHGRLVPWTITVTSIGNSSASIHYEFHGDMGVSLFTPRSPVVILENETFDAQLSFDGDCDLHLELSSPAVSETKIDETAYEIVLLVATENTPRKGTLTGQIGCRDRPYTTIKIDWNIINHRLSNDTLEATIPWDESSIVSLFPDYEGEGSRNYRISIDGPASRVANAITNGDYFPGDPITLDVEPDGLLEPRMIARGELVIIDSNNIEQRIPIVLNSEGELPFGPLNWLSVPSNAIATVLILLAFSIASGSKKITTVD